MKTILAIDPGPSESHCCTYNGSIPVSFTTFSNELLRHEILFSKDYRNYDCVIEMIASYGMPVGETVFNTCIWIGRFIEAMHPTPVALLFRKAVKMHLCGQSKARDSNIIQALKDRFGEKGTKKKPGLLYGIKADQWQALALAVTYSDAHK